jgi:FdhD protein
MAHRTQPAHIDVSALERRNGIHRELERALAHESPVEVRYGGTPFATLMASPADLEDFAVGFSLAERIVGSARDVLDVRAEGCAAGYVLDITLPGTAIEALTKRTRRALTVNSSCGLCGRVSLEDALPDLPRVDDSTHVDLAAMERAVAALADAQHLNRIVRAVHGAAWVDCNGQIQLLREDVGRHNALDKLIGARARGGDDDNGRGFCIVTSRASYEMVEKAAIAGIGVLVALSAPTALAHAMAQECGMTLVALARSDGCMVFTGLERLVNQTSREEVFA